MRTQSDPQWSHHSDAPACTRCGLPLLEGTRMCPFCERKVHQSAASRVADRSRRILRPGPDARTVLGLPEPVVLAVLVFTFAAIAIASALTALFAA